MNNSMIIGIDKINFLYAAARIMNCYLLCISADNKGKLMITEPVSSSLIWHKPVLKKPAVWDFGGSGYLFYQRTGGLADILVYHVIIVKDNSQARQAGEILKKISSSKEVTDSAVNLVNTVVKSNPTALMVTTIMEMSLKILKLIGEILNETPDRVLQTISGSWFFDDEHKKMSERSDTIKSPDSNMEVEIDAFLFNTEGTEDSIAEISGKKLVLKDNKLTIE